MPKQAQKNLSPEISRMLLQTLQHRFEKNKHRHEGIDWAAVQQRLINSAEKCWSLHAMEHSGGEPDVVGFDDSSEEYLFFDCSPESPAGRRSLCYDRHALNERKEHKPSNSALDAALEMGIEVLTEEQYRSLQRLGKFDTKTSSWIHTPEAVRKLGGALFGDYRYGQVFIYHNGASSYYAARGFRGALRV